MVKFSGKLLFSFTFFLTHTKYRENRVILKKILCNVDNEGWGWIVDMRIKEKGEEVWEGRFEVS